MDTRESRTRPTNARRPAKVALTLRGEAIALPTIPRWELDLVGDRLRDAIEDRDRELGGTR